LLDCPVLMIALTPPVNDFDCPARMTRGGGDGYRLSAHYINDDDDCNYCVKDGCDECCSLRKIEV
jgi:hypothetical protein